MRKYYLLLILLAPFLFAGSIQQKHLQVVRSRVVTTVTFTSPTGDGQVVCYDNAGGNEQICWDNCHGAASGTTTNTANDTVVGHSESGAAPSAEITRPILMWATAATLPDDAQVLSVQIKLTCTIAVDNDTADGEISVVNLTSYAGALDNSDFSKLGTTKYATTALSALTCDDAADNTTFTLSAASYGDIQLSGANNTEFGLREKYDIDDSPPGGKNRGRFNSFDDAVAAKRPHLIVTYR